MPGKLDREARHLAEKYDGSVFIVLVPTKGGLHAALAATAEETIKMPATLRHLADEMQKSHGTARRM